MPLYEFYCPLCSNRIEKKLSIAEYDIWSDSNDRLECPTKLPLGTYCGGELKRRWSPPAVRMN